jgi:hypothetical protein
MSSLNVIFTLLGAIGGVVWLVNQFKTRLSARAFFSVFRAGEEIVIVVPSLGHSEPNITMTFEDALACASAQTEFVRHHVPYKVRLHTQITPDDRSQNMFIIGGEVVNDVTAAVASAAQLPVRAEPNTAGTQITYRGVTLHPPLQFGKTDYAIIGVLQNPWSNDPRKRVYIAAGAEGVGTWAAALQLTANAQQLARHLRAHDISAKGHFQAVLDVEVRGYQLPASYIRRVIQLA